MTTGMGLKSYFGTKTFYRAVLSIMFPILLQNVITTFVNLLDNIMVGQVGTEEMSGVAIANQLLSVFVICISGALSGVGIYTAQYYGKGDEKGIRDTMRAKLYVSVIACLLFAAVFYFAGGKLIASFLHEGSEGLDLALTYQQGMTYLHIMMLQILPFAIAQVYATTLRECSEAMMPMLSGVIATAVNLIGNYILIFGRAGAPKLGVKGAAIATVIARFIELLLLIIYAHTHQKKFTFLSGLFRSVRIPLPLVKNIAKKGTPLLLNAGIWAAGMAMLNQCYSVRGLEVVSATNISSTIANVFFATSIAMGSVIAILIGQHLGAGRLKQAEEDDKKLIMMTLIMAAVLGAVMAALSSPLVSIYNTTPSVRSLAASLIKIISVLFPFQAYTNACYYTLRSGGKTIITFIFDSVCAWAVFIPVALILVHCTNLAIIPIYWIVNGIDILKCVAGYLLLRSKTWIVNLVGTKASS